MRRMKLYPIDVRDAPGGELPQSLVGRSRLRSTCGLIVHAWRRICGPLLDMDRHLDTVQFFASVCFGFASGLMMSEKGFLWYDTEGMCITRVCARQLELEPAGPEVQL